LVAAREVGVDGYAVRATPREFDSRPFFARNPDSAFFACAEDLNHA